jgi:short-subunit dehydrogenase
MRIGRQRERWEHRGKVAIVTGASSGIGRDVATALARRGTVVIGVARRDDLLARSAAEWRAHAPGSTYLAGDLGDRTFAERVVAETVAAHGRVDVLVNNAGIPSHKPIYEVTPDDVERLLRVNFLASVWTTLAAIPSMLCTGGGVIVNVSSMASRVAPPRETAYTASKCALDGFTAGLWTDLAGSNIHVALVTPGPIDTEIWEKDETPSGYQGVKHPPRIVTAAILDAIERRRHEVIVPRWSPQLLAARLLRTVAPSLLRAGMQWMEPVPPATIDAARARAREAAARAADGAWSSDADAR